MLKSSKENEVGAIENAHITTLMYKIRRSGKDSVDLSTGFYRNITARERELINKKRLKGNFQAQFFDDVLGFAEPQESATHGLVCKPTLPTSSDNKFFKTWN